VPRAPFQVLVFPYRISLEKVQYALFKRSDNSAWQGIAGGGEDRETPFEAAARESIEEAGVPKGSTLIQLGTISSIPVTAFTDSFHWGNAIYVIPEYCFGIEAQGIKLCLSAEHLEIRWLGYSEAICLLRFDGNKTALWELNQKLHGCGPRDRAPG
jgi:dATP pyrophosphohydrolase